MQRIHLYGRRFHGIIACMAFGLTATPATAFELLDGKIRADIYVMQAWQTLEADDNAYNLENSDTSSGFNRIRATIGLTLKLNDRISGYVELSEEPDDFGDTFQFSNDLAYLDYQITDPLVLRFGNLVTTTMNFLHYSDGAAVQTNPFSNNSIADFVTAESGIQLIGTHALNGAFKSFGWDVGITKANFGEGEGAVFAADVPYQYMAKARLALSSAWSFGVGYFTVDGSDRLNPAGGNGVATGSGMWFGDGDNFNLPGSHNTAARDLHSGLVPGIDARLWSAEAQFEYAKGYVRGSIGQGEDEWRFIGADGSQAVLSIAADVVRSKSRVSFYTAETRFDVSPKVYIAGRYSYAQNDSPGVPGSPDQQRIQLGVGLWLTEGALIKAEYLRQLEERGGPGQIGDDLDGVMIETSVAF